MKVSAVVLGSALAFNPPFVAAESPEVRTSSELQTMIASLDAQVFDAFKRCSEPEEFARHARFFDRSVEFSHDTGGVTWSREEMLARTRENVCGKYTRELVEGSLRVFPIRDFGAIAQGTHRFCQAATGTCEGVADFTILWREQGGTWQITRVLSYAHRAAVGDP